jgi:Concanavalin A-like lectin/glucanases superfamily
VARGLSGAQSLTRADHPDLRVPFPMALSCWFRGGPQGAFRYLATKLLLAGEHPSYALTTATNGDLRFIVGWGASPGNFTVSQQVGQAFAFNNAWNHFMGTYDGAFVRLHLNGVEIGPAVAETRALAYSANNVYVGSFDGTQLFATGSVAELSLWGVVPDAADRAALARGVSPLVVRPSGLVAHWPLVGRTDPETEVMGGLGLSAGSTTNADHTRVYLRPSTKVTSGLSARIGSGTALAGAAGSGQASKTSPAAGVGHVGVVGTGGQPIPPVPEVGGTVTVFGLGGAVTVFGLGGMVEVV